MIKDFEGMWSKIVCIKVIQGVDTANTFGKITTILLINIFDGNIFMNTWKKLMGSRGEMEELTNITG